MAKGKFPGMPGNMNNMLKQAQKLQESMIKVQEELERRTYEAQVGGGAVTAKVSGKKELLEIVIKPEVVDPEDVEMLQDLIVAAVNEALRKATEESVSEMAKITGAMNIPGLF